MPPIVLATSTGRPEASYLVETRKPYRYSSSSHAGASAGEVGIAGIGGAATIVPVASGGTGSSRQATASSGSTGKSAQVGRARGVQEATVALCQPTATTSSRS